MTKAPKRGRGRPALEGKAMQQVALRLPVETFDAVDKIIAARMGATDRAAVLREAVARGLAQMQGRK